MVSCAELLHPSQGNLTLSTVAIQALLNPLVLRTPRRYRNEMYCGWIDNVVPKNKDTPLYVKNSTPSRSTALT